MLALPHMIVSIRHYRDELTLMGSDAAHALVTRHYLRLELTYLCESILRIVLWLTGARWLYSCGPWLQSFFGAAGPDEAPATALPTKGA